MVLHRHGIRLDAAALARNALVPDYLGPDHTDPARRNALGFQSWNDLARGGGVWVNPPYQPTQDLRGFLGRAAATAAAGTEVAALVPYSPATRWWSETVEAPAARVEVVGRLAYGGPHSNGGRAPWASALLVYEPQRGLVDRLLRAGGAPLSLLRSLL